MTEGCTKCVTEKEAEDITEDKVAIINLLFEPGTSQLLYTLHQCVVHIALSLTFFSDGICGLSGFVFHVLHHAVYLGLMLQEDRTDDAPVEQLCPIRRAGGHAPQQEATLQGAEHW